MSLRPTGASNTHYGYTYSVTLNVNKSPLLADMDELVAVAQQLELITHGVVQPLRFEIKPKTNYLHAHTWLITPNTPSFKLIKAAFPGYQVYMRRIKSVKGLRNWKNYCEKVCLSNGELENEITKNCINHYGNAFSDDSEEEKTEGTTKTPTPLAAGPGQGNDCPVSSEAV